ncbi:ATP synthase subunit d, mitochondrial-like [Plodia interpunctella]|uniref:ATP synthase subunit d, mitochondrial-like n=1 Tax=Plodia interpunctella TaxID=58824 RepID=UPI002368BEB6|nr:ATP synthase subunit d, mitochondrial-like [Plodia interpunctella]
MAKRFGKPSINWAELDKRVPPDQKPNFLVFKAKSESYWRRVNASPPEPPKIDWEAYKKTVPIPDLVDKFKTAYEGFKVPMPTDTMSAKVDEQWKSLEPQIKAFCAEQQKYIDQATKDLAAVNALPKFEEMTMEIYYDMYPETRFDPVRKPTFWPHIAEEQPGYKPPATPAAAPKAAPKK